MLENLIGASGDTFLFISLNTHKGTGHSIYGVLGIEPSFNATFKTNVLSALYYSVPEHMVLFILNKRLLKDTLNIF